MPRSIPRLMVVSATFAFALSAGVVVAKAEASNEVDEQLVSFELDVQPILTARGCNQGACHGKQRGQNGFQLSLLGFDPDFDYAALTMNARGRRVFPAAPERSLLLLKGAARLPHGGGVRIEYGGEDYETLRRWIAEGLTRRIENEPTLTGIRISHQERSLRPGESFSLRVEADYSDGTTRDVTSRTAYQSNESAVVAVDDDGVVTAGPLPGEAAVMARYMGYIGVCSVAIPLESAVEAAVYQNLPRQNFVDELVWKKLEALRITPSAPVDDARFLRRAHIDIIGRLPTPEEVRTFLADDDPNKRIAVVDRLLQRPEYADHWANKWADLLRPNAYRVGIKAVLNYDDWIRQQFRDNRPYDEFVYDLLTARGSTFHNGAVTLFRDRREPDEITTMVSRLFLGIRLECAKCHHHPFEKWGQDDFYSLAAYFARLGRKGRGLSPPISGSEEIVKLSTKGDVSHPLTGEVLEPRPLFGEAPIGDEDVDRREALARWITNDNPFFAQVMANRVWADLMGRGIVDPVDDLRATNPPSNGPLLEALAADFRDSGYDIKHLIRRITTSYVYGLSSLPNDRNLADTRNYSRHYRQRLRAEVLLDAVTDITGVHDSFSGMPPKSRASQIWTHRIGSLFLDTFGRPDPNQDPPCERIEESTVTQTLHLMNAPALHSKVTSDKATAAQLAASERTVDGIVEELYLLMYGRLPEAEEREVGRRLFAEKDMTRRQATEDLMWALLNTPEFVFKD
ncbi:MAG: DUF1549 and DUF1553 domain-containing protein [Pirellulaceae bacterium]